MFGPELYSIPGKVRGYDSSQTAPHGEHAAREEMLPAEDGEEILVLQSQISINFRDSSRCTDPGGVNPDQVPVSGSDTRKTAQIRIRHNFDLIKPFSFNMQINIIDLSG